MVARTIEDIATLDPQAGPSEGILAILPHTVMVVGPQGEILFANAAAENFLEISASALTRSKLTDIFPFDSPLINLVANVRATGASIQEYDVNISTVRIGKHTVDTLVAPMGEEGDRFLVLLNERGMADTMTRQLTHQGAARSVRAMASVLAHEIKNPLAGIRGAAQLLESTISDEDSALVYLIRNETDRVCKLVDRLEVFTDNRPVERKPVNIHSVLNRVKEIAQSSFARTLTIKEVYDPSLPMVPGDRDQLIQVFLNLVKNASDAAREQNGEITLTTAYQPGMRLSLPGSPKKVNLPLEVCVIDNGAGVAPDLLPHLFDPFVTTKAKGTGLGLALVAKIIADHGGVVDCQSALRRTTFRTMLPMYVEEEAASYE